MDDGNEWSSEGRIILTPDRLSAVRDVLDNVGPVIVEHWFYYGGRSPDRFLFEDYNTFLDYLTTNARPGDALHIWSFAQVCQDGNTLVNGKYPDQQGRVPKGGAY